VDIGAGAGKAMILAADHGYLNVRGAELVKELCEVAEGNFRRFQKNFPNVNFSIHHTDALEFSFEEKDAFFLLNDPFSEEIFRPFLERVKEFSKKANHEIFLAYKNNNLRRMPSLMEFRQHCSDYQEFDMSGNFFQIYVMKGKSVDQTSIS
jgi:tRNA1(Val) A37 N6-methylase TrmN6